MIHSSLVEILVGLQVSWACDVVRLVSGLVVCSHVASFLRAISRNCLISVTSRGMVTDWYQCGRIVYWFGECWCCAVPGVSCAGCLLGWAILMFVGWNFALELVKLLPEISFDSGMCGEMSTVEHGR